MELRAERPGDPWKMKTPLFGVLRLQLSDSDICMCFLAQAMHRCLSSI